MRAREEIMDCSGSDPVLSDADDGCTESKAEIIAAWKRQLDSGMWTNFPGHWHVPPADVIWSGSSNVCVADQPSHTHCLPVTEGIEAKPFTVVGIPSADAQAVCGEFFGYKEHVFVPPQPTWAYVTYNPQLPAQTMIYTNHDLEALKLIEQDKAESEGREPDQAVLDAIEQERIWQSIV